MPIIGNQEPPPIQPLYFKSLKELDGWIPGALERYHDGILKYSPRSLQPAVDAQANGKLLVILPCLRIFGDLTLLQVCHDYKVNINELIP